MSNNTEEQMSNSDNNINSGNNVSVSGNGNIAAGNNVENNKSSNNNTKISIFLIVFISGAAALAFTVGKINTLNNKLPVTPIQTETNN